MTNRILKMLKTADGYISGVAISAECGISREAVRKHINKLKAAGYKIESVTNKGYRLSEIPDILDEEDIRDALTAKRMGSRIMLFDEVDSTNIVLKQNSSLPEGTVAAAEAQTAGRGRLGRSWSSAKGSGLWFSVLLKPDTAPEHVSLITLAAGLAVCRAIGGSARIKWPNDIIIGSKKVCGILTEMSAETDAVNYVICGIGINVNTPVFESELADKATSLLIETGQKHSRSELLASVLNYFEPYYDRLKESGFASLRSEYAQLCITLGREVIVNRRSGVLHARAVDISDSGELIIKTPDGTEALNSGEVSVRGLLGYV